MIEQAWWLSSVADLRWPGVTYTGQEPPKAVALIHRYLALYQQEAMKRMQETIQFMKEHASHGNNEPAPAPNLFSPEPSISSYLCVIYELILPPQVVFNTTTYHLLLEIEAAQKGPHRLQKLTEEYHLPLEEVLNEILPSFSFPFMKPPAESTAQ